MDSRVRSLNKLVRDYDRDLFVKRDGEGICHLYRKKKLADRFKFGGVNYVHVVLVDDYVCSFTDNWWHDGRPVEWGLDNIWRKLRQMDSWTNVDGFDNFTRSRARAEQDKERMQRNELRALAADSRRDFAKATNDVTVKANSFNKKYF